MTISTCSSSASSSSHAEALKNWRGLRAMTLTSFAPRRSEVRQQSIAVLPTPMISTRSPIDFDVPERHRLEPGDADVDVGGALGAAGQLQLLALRARRCRRTPHRSRPWSSSSFRLLTGWLSFRSTPMSTICAISSLSTVGRQPERRDVGAHQAARLAVLLEDRDLVAERHEVVGHRERGAAGADAGDRLPFLSLGIFGSRAVMSSRVIGGDALQAADGDRLFFDAAAAAGRLAGPVADAPEDAGEHVRVAVHHVGVGEAALRDQPDVFGHVGVGWARPLAIHDFVEVVGLRGVRRLHIPPGKTPVFPLRRVAEYRLPPINDAHAQRNQAPDPLARAGSGVRRRCALPAALRIPARAFAVR